MNGATNITLSNRSKTPPWPGIIFPLSLTPAIRLNFDSIKSPIVPITPTIAAIIIQINIDLSLNWADGLIKYIEIKYPANIAKINPPKKPSIVFFGDIFSNNLFFPIDLPTI